MRASVNVNLLTHLEFDRVNNLVTVEKKSVKQAKNQALSEILSAFHIDPATIEGYAEDMDIFGKTDADAALLAISVLLLANLDDADFANLLTEISSDMESDGRWDDAEAKVRIAEWAMKAEMSGRLESIRQNVASFYHVSGSVPEFEKYVRNFWQTELGVGECNRSIDGDVVDVPNELSNVGSLECDEGTWKFFELRDLRDGKTYKVVKIGGQVWMAENLKAKIGLDGSPITMYCNSEVRDFCTDYGGLYTWEDAKKACPSGWHLPAQTDWKTLVDTVDAMNKEAGKMLKSYDFWNGVDRYGFNALPAGYRDGDDYYGFGEFTIFWSSTEKAKSSAHVFTLYGEYDAAAFSDQLMSDAASVRCVQDE